MLRLTFTALVLSALFAATSQAARVSPPNAGTPDSDIPDHYTRAAIVGEPRVTSNGTNDGRGGELQLTAWNWQDRDGRTYRLTRRLRVMKNGPVGSLGNFDLEVSAPTRKPAARPTKGNMQLPPKGKSDERIPSIYTKTGVLDLTMTSSVSEDRGDEITETTWRWKDRNGVSYTLKRKKSGNQSSFNLATVG